METIVIGGNGYVGSSLVDAFRGLAIKTHATVRSTANDKDSTIQLQIEDPGSVLNFIRQLKNFKGIKTAFVCAAISNVDACFRDPQGSRKVNVEGTIETLKGLVDLGITPIYFSSDYVFDGSRPEVTELERRNPQTEYGRQKATVEQWLETCGQDYVVFRTSKVFSTRPLERNPLFGLIRGLASGQTMTNVVDQWITPVFLEDLINPVLFALRGQLRGVYHLASRPTLSRYETAIILAKGLGLDPANVKAGRLSDLKLQEQRPHYCSLLANRILAYPEVRFRSVEDFLPELKHLV